MCECCNLIQCKVLIILPSSEFAVVTVTGIEVVVDFDPIVVVDSVSFLDVDSIFIVVDFVPIVVVDSVSVLVVDSIFIVVDVSEEKLVVSEDEQSGDIPLHLL